MTLTFPDRLRGAAKSAHLSEQKYQNAFNSWYHELTPLENPRFWKLLKLFRNLIKHSAFERALTDRVEVACDEFFRRPVANHFYDELKYSFEEANRFAVAYEGKAAALYTPLFDLGGDRMDDAYGDLIDSLPLAGAPIYDRCLLGGYQTCGQIERDVRRAVGVQMGKLILEGENYVGSSLVGEMMGRVKSYLVYQEST